MSDWVELEIPRDLSRWPNMCPGCLRPNPEFRCPIESDGVNFLSTTGITLKYESLWVSVPFCEECADHIGRRLKLRYLSIWLIGLTILVSVVLSLWLDLNRWQAILLTLLLGIPTMWLRLRPEPWLRISSYDKSTITLKIKRPEYARECARLNNELISGMARSGR